MHSNTRQIIRRPKVSISILGSNSFHLRNPWVVAWWSLAYPGFGHLTCGSTIKGILLFLGELVINYKAKINLAIIYSFTGNIPKAKDVLNTEWLLLYSSILLFAVWDSYRIVIEYNKASVLADRENDPISPTTLGSMGINLLDKRTPWASAFWSLLLPGLGQIYLAETVKAVFLISITTLIFIYSHALPAIIYTALGDFHQAKSILDWQWFLNLPSFYTFAIWDAIVNTVEINKLFEIEQANYFKTHFQDPRFIKPINHPGG